MTAAAWKWLMRAGLCMGGPGAGIDLGVIAAGGSLTRWEQAVVVVCLLAVSGSSMRWT